MNEFNTVFLFTDISVPQNYMAGLLIIIFTLFVGWSFLYWYLLLNIHIPEQLNFIKDFLKRKLYIKNYEISTVEFLNSLIKILLFSLILAIFIIIIDPGTPMQPSTFRNPEYSKLQKIYDSQQYWVVEGIVHVLHAQNYYGHEEGDIVKIGDIEFEFSNFTITFGYKQTISHGGVLTEGTYARVFYIENPPDYLYLGKYMILRIDIKT